MIVEVMTIVTMMTYPVNSTDAILPTQIIHKNPTSLQQSITVHLNRAWKEYKISEFIASSA